MHEASLKQTFDLQCIQLFRGVTGPIQICYDTDRHCFTKPMCLIHNSVHIAQKNSYELCQPLPYFINSQGDAIIYVLGTNMTSCTTKPIQKQP